jgi:hypothetical protein
MTMSRIPRVASGIIDHWLVVDRQQVLVDGAKRRGKGNHRDTLG